MPRFTVEAVRGLLHHIELHKSFPSSGKDTRTHTHAHTHRWWVWRDLGSKTEKRLPLMEYDSWNNNHKNTLRRLEGSRFDKRNFEAMKYDSSKRTDHSALSYVIWTLNKDLWNCYEEEVSGGAGGGLPWGAIYSAWFLLCGTTTLLSHRNSSLPSWKWPICHQKTGPYHLRDYYCWDSNILQIGCWIHIAKSHQNRKQ